MDPERQPLLSPNENVRLRAHRPLTYEEVAVARQDVSWRRARFCVVLMFWAIMAMFLSMIACLLIQNPSCNTYDSKYPSVPPVHMSLGFVNGRVDVLDPVLLKDKGLFERATAN